MSFFFRFVKQSFFRTLINLLRSNTSLSERTKMIKICQEYVATIEKAIKQRLQSISQYFLTLNIWTSKHQQLFLKTTIYFIDDQWQFQKLLLAFKPLLTNHTRWEMINVVLLILIRYAFDSDLLTVTTDNASFNQTLQSHLSNLLQQKFNVKWNHHQDIIRCMIHVMQLMFEAIFKTLKIKNDVVNEVVFNSAAIATIKIDVLS